MSWISRFGFLLGVAVAVTLLTTFFAVKYYRVARDASPVHAQELEHELADLRTSYQQLVTSTQAATAAQAVPAAPASAVPASAAAAPAAPSAESQIPPPAAVEPVSTRPATPTQGVLFTALASDQTGAIPDVATLPFKVNQPSAVWRGGSLKVHFNIQYTNTDSGNQQGRIIILARGPDMLLAYPDGVLSRAGAASLLQPAQGEYFSVSRFREVNAEFSVSRPRTSVKDVEILILNLQGRLLYSQNLAPEAKIEPARARPATGAGRPAAAKPVSPLAPAAPAVPAAPKPEVIEPGVDQ